MARRWIVVCILAGCNAIYGLDDTGLEEPVDVDADDDGIDDEIDNCPIDHNDLQEDEDEDGVGNACDNCPLVANARQTDIDVDSVGDNCDPHPLLFGDCLVLFDSFDNRGAFEANWEVVDSEAAAVVTPGNGVVDVDATAVFGRMFLAARNVSGAFDVHGVMETTVTADGAYVAVASSILPPPAPQGIEPHYGCGLAAPSTSKTPSAKVESAGTDFGALSITTGLASSPIGSVLTARLQRFAPDATLHLRCRVEYGVAASVIGIDLRTVPQPQDLREGRPGLMVTAAHVELRGIAVYGYTPTSSMECAPAVRR
jgi:hypothetical protein